MIYFKGNSRFCLTDITLWLWVITFKLFCLRITLMRLTQILTINWFEWIRFGWRWISLRYFQIRIWFFWNGIYSHTHKWYSSVVRAELRVFPNHSITSCVSWFVIYCFIIKRIRSGNWLIMVMKGGYYVKNEEALAVLFQYIQKLNFNTQMFLFFSEYRFKIYLLKHINLFRVWFGNLAFNNV